MDAAAVGFVERGFENEAAQSLPQGGCEKVNVPLTFNYTRPGDEGKRETRAKNDRTGGV